MAGFAKTIYDNNNIVNSKPTLTNSSNNTSDTSGLYRSFDTNSGTSTYYFRGNVTNNYVSFAGFTWRIVRINEDGTVRLIMQDGINSNSKYKFTSQFSGTYKYSYYSNSDVRSHLNSWYTNNLSSYSSLIATGNYYCEQAKVKRASSLTSGSANMTVYSDYTPNFKCSTDGNGYGIVNANIGLITYDELVHAGGYFDKDNSSYYLYNDNYSWTMSSSGQTGYSEPFVWYYKSGRIYLNRGDTSYTARPVINLKSDVKVTGTGTSADPYVISSFKDKILANNTIITAAPTLTDSSNNTTDASGLYKSTATNSGDPTYYFRGNVTNNYVSFAGFTWRIVRINEDGTVRLIMQDGINNNTTYSFSPLQTYKDFYYTNSNAKTVVDAWYTTNIINKGYADSVAIGNYYCEQARVGQSLTGGSIGNASMVYYSDYTPNFKCSVDGNGYGIVNSNVGLITYDELVYAGGYFNKSNSDYYINNNTTTYYAMSPAGYGSSPYIWFGIPKGALIGNSTTAGTIRPVINLKSDVLVSGTGTSADPYVIE